MNIPAARRTTLAGRLGKQAEDKRLFAKEKGTETPKETLEKKAHPDEILQSVKKQGGGAR